MRWAVPLTISDTLLVQYKDLTNDILMKEHRCEGPPHRKRFHLHREAHRWRLKNVFDEEVFVRRISDM